MQQCLNFLQNVATKEQSFKLADSVFQRDAWFSIKMNRAKSIMRTDLFIYYLTGRTWVQY